MLPHRLQGDGLLAGVALLVTSPPALIETRSDTWLVTGRPTFMVSGSGLGLKGLAADVAKIDPLNDD